MIQRHLGSAPPRDSFANVFPSCGSRSKRNLVSCFLKGRARAHKGVSLAHHPLPGALQWLVCGWRASAVAGGAMRGRVCVCTKRRDAPELPVLGRDEEELVGRLRPRDEREHRLARLVGGGDVDGLARHEAQLGLAQLGPMQVPMRWVNGTAK